MPIATGFPQFAPAAVRDEGVQVLRSDGTVADTVAVELDDDEVLAALRLMLLSRRFDERALNLQRQGRFGTFSQVTGQEATVVGCALAVDPRRDWLVPQYRELPALLHHGLPLANFILTFTGHPLGGRIPDGVNILPIQISLAAQLPHAAGLAWGLQHQGLDGVVVAFVGDGASSEGDFHESVNLAGVRRLPVVFVVSDNGWAISTPRASQTYAANFAARGPGYGIPGSVVDGNDLFAVHAVVADAVARARAGGGPTLVEALTYRVGAHNTADDPSRYRSTDDVARWIERDPITRVQAYLTRKGRWDEVAAASWAVEIDDEITEALTAAAAHGAPGLPELFDHVYAEPIPRLRAQRSAIEQAVLT
jgi:pyruvate dehydrogenase E1 component alpha subunit